MQIKCVRCGRYDGTCVCAHKPEEHDSQTGECKAEGASDEVRKTLCKCKLFQCCYEYD